MKLLSLLILLALALLLRKLAWCLRWLWHYHHGRPLPPSEPWLPQKSGALFDAHIRQARDGQEDEYGPVEKK